MNTLFKTDDIVNRMVENSNLSKPQAREAVAAFTKAVAQWALESEEGDTLRMNNLGVFYKSFTKDRTYKVFGDAANLVDVQGHGRITFKTSAGLRGALKENVK